MLRMISANWFAKDLSGNSAVKGNVPAGNDSGETVNLGQHLRLFQ